VTEDSRRMERTGTWW